MKNKENLFTILALVIAIAPIGVFGYFPESAYNLYRADAISGNGLLYLGIGVLAVMTTMFVYRLIYFREDQPVIIVHSLWSGVVFYVYMMIFGASITALMTRLGMIPESTTLAPALALSLLIGLITHYHYESELYKTRKNSSNERIFDHAHEETLAPSRRMIILLIVLIFGVSLLIPETTPYLILVTSLLAWTGVYLSFIRLHIVKKIVTWKRSKK